MKEILMSIRPEWCKLIFSGEKTIEVRKTAPKLYDKPRALGEFYDGRGRPIKRAFQSWGYCNGEEN